LAQSLNSIGNDQSLYLDLHHDVHVTRLGHTFTAYSYVIIDSNLYMLACVWYHNEPYTWPLYSDCYCRI